MSKQDARIKRLNFTTDAGAGDRARIGLLVLESDQTMEWEFRALTDLPGVSVYHSRLANDVTVTPETLGRMEAELPIAAGLLPDYMGLNAIGYGCTSASTIIGEERVAEIFEEAHPGVPSTNPLTAAKVALGALGVKRLGLLTPYSPEVTDAMQAKFNTAGIDVTVVGSFYEQSDLVVGKIDPKSILQAAISVGQSPDVDGVFISCTSLRAAGIIEQAEQTLGKPVTASNHALAWHLLRLAGIEDTVDNAGQLFREQLRVLTDA
ncbi:aspartate/glutamate racemase family protein [Roseovarius sp. EL26]|uniref:maleate cis-trans isomerase family protein n=1 Tax=Roseovarius sp. EL26 TaxID=2126672 RepID=UPI000EA2606A|nr:aspartate/glutamate racemase family protein [Roseovarius sp. EL26]